MKLNSALDMNLSLQMAMEKARNEISIEKRGLNLNLGNLGDDSL
jgi:hypothetical protein